MFVFAVLDVSISVNYKEIFLKTVTTNHLLHYLFGGVYLFFLFKILLVYGVVYYYKPYLSVLIHH